MLLIIIGQTVAVVGFFLFSIGIQVELEKKFEAGKNKVVTTDADLPPIRISNLRNDPQGFTDDKGNIVERIRVLTVDEKEDK